MGYVKANVIFAPDPDPLIDIRLESGEIGDPVIDRRRR